MRDNIKVIIDDTELELEFAFIGGILADETKAPMGAYSGKGDIGMMSFVVMQSLRAVIKLAREELQLTPQEVHTLLHFSADEALKTELAGKPEENGTLKQHEIYLKMIREGKAGQ